MNVDTPTGSAYGDDVAKGAAIQRDHFMPTSNATLTDGILTLTLAGFDDQPDVVWTKPIDQMHPETLARLIRVGASTVGRNVWAGKAEDPATSRDKAVALITGLECGEATKGGGGGPRLDLRQKALRNILSEAAIEWLAKKGKKDQKQASIDEAIEEIYAEAK